MRSLLRARLSHWAGSDPPSCIWLVLPIVLFASLAAEAQNDVSLQLNDIHNQNADVTFATPTIGQTIEKPSDKDLQQMSEALTQHHKYKLYSDPSETTANKFGFFIYTFYVQELGQNADHKWWKYEVKANPGNFMDAQQPVQFTVQHGTAADDGAIEVLLHSFSDQPLISITPASPLPVPVRLSSGDSISLNIENLSPKVAVTISGHGLLSIQQEGLWNTHPGEMSVNNGADFVLHGGGKQSVSFYVIPKKLPALLKTLTSLKPDVAHDTVSLILPYSAEQGGAPKSTAPVPVPVRFVPSIPALVLALVMGSFLGTVTSQLLPGVWKNWRVLLTQSGRALAFSLVGELIAMLLVGLGSQFVLFTFNLDPWQFLPVLVIGFLVSGGKEVLKLIGLGSYVQQKSTAAATAGDGQR